MRVRDLFLRNLPVKLLSLFFALVLWGVVIGERKAQVQLNIPLELVNMPEEAVLVTDVPANISVVVRGPRTLIRSLPGRGVTKSIDLEELGIGWTAIRIPPDSINVPRGIEANDPDGRRDPRPALPPVRTHADGSSCDRGRRDRGRHRRLGGGVRGTRRAAVGAPGRRAHGRA